ncbi:hypothetical protein [Mesorhizobium sp. 1M-11]|uniref:hypothetical protein n=1 Tax=Mesorhizobium sp. 1M-11 TaxID=1529006 RepID=UPI0006C75701|nr:hypothetical protein [Mesorhizobium sp. 1M-11]
MNRFLGNLLAGFGVVILALGFAMKFSLASAYPPIKTDIRWPNTDLGKIVTGLKKLLSDRLLDDLYLGADGRYVLLPSALETNPQQGKWEICRFDDGSEGISINALDPGCIGVYGVVDSSHDQISAMVFLYNGGKKSTEFHSLGKGMSSEVRVLANEASKRSEFIAAGIEAKDYDRLLAVYENYMSVKSCKNVELFFTDADLQKLESIARDLEAKVHNETLEKQVWEIANNKAGFTSEQAKTDPSDVSELCTKTLKEYRNIVGRSVKLLLEKPF